jgi:hypothetical protein
MKLKKVEATEMDESSAAAFPAVDAALAMGAAPAPKRSGGVATLIAVLASLAAAAMVGAVAAMMYVNWELIANA